ncbi:MAG: hypothetical protein NXI16_07395 [Alphaproteobacteria bacterium]|nr:hypothetical protein [Alphaproteobacteria bacterium]
MVKRQAYRLIAAAGLAAALMTGVVASAAEETPGNAVANTPQPFFTPRDPSQMKALRWLSQEPVTLMDMGILRLRDEMAIAVDRLADEAIGLEPPVTGSYYNWRGRQIVAYAIFAEPFDDRTPERCAHVFERLVATLTHKAPQGPGQASWFLENLFTHTGPRGFRPHELGDRLVELVSLEVSLAGTRSDRRAGDHKRLRCEGRLDAPPEGLKNRLSGTF